MKHFTIIFLILFSVRSSAQLALPIDFEASDSIYVFTDFDGGQMTVEENPDMSGINTSAKVSRMIKNAGQPWAGSYLELDDAIDFSAGKHFKLKVWAPSAGTAVLFKVENSENAGIAFEKQVLTTNGGAWEELIFDFSGINTNEAYRKIIFIFNNGTVGDGSSDFTYYIDDIELFEGGSGLAKIDLPITFEDTATVDYGLVDFGGNVSSIVTDPTDANNLVGQATKTAGAEVWAGTTIGGNGLASAIPFTAEDTRMSVRIWSPAANTPIRLKVEDAGNPAISVETEVNTTMASTWETLEFNFSEEATGTAPLTLTNTYNKISIFFNFGTGGATAGEQTYYWDDITFIGGGGGVLTQVDLPITFEDTAMVDYALVDFGGNVSSIVTDPTDEANLVGRAVKTGEAESWAGTTIGAGGLANPIPFSEADTRISVRIWSPDAGVPVRLKVEDATAPNISVETELLTSTAGDWETLEFDFKNQAEGTAPLNLDNTYDKISIFFNFGITGAMAGEKTFYWDDIQFGMLTSFEQQRTFQGLVKTYPNPTSDFYTVEFVENMNEPVRLLMYDVNGRRVMERMVNQAITRINTNHLAEGFYSLFVEDGSSRHFLEKLLIFR